MRQALEPSEPLLGPVITAKHRLFRLGSEQRTYPAVTLIASLRTTTTSSACCTPAPTSFGRWRKVRQLEDRPRYTPTTCFQTFPLPWPPGDEPADSPLVEAVAEAARRLNELREGWLNPEGPLVGADELKRRTLTNLYNERPAWLDTAHRRLDEAVFNAYGWPPGLSDDEVLGTPPRAQPGAGGGARSSDTPARRGRPNLTLVRCRHKLA